jgi:hypothetical protein
MVSAEDPYGRNLGFLDRGQGLYKNNNNDSSPRSYRYESDSFALPFFLVVQYNLSKMEPVLTGKFPPCQEYMELRLSYRSERLFLYSRSL